MPVDRKRDHAWTRLDARLSTATTSACWGSEIPPHIGRQRFSRAAFSVSGTPLAVAELAERWLQVERRFVVGGEADPRLPSAARAGRARRYGRSTCGRRGRARRAGARRSRPGRAPRSARRPRGGPRSSRQVRQEDAQHRGLNRVEPAVVADQLELLLRLRAVEAEHPDPLGERGVVDGDEAAVAECEQVLGREEAERRGDARRDPGGAEGLARRPRPAAARSGAAPRAAPGGRTGAPA